MVVLAVGFAAMLACLALQALASMLAARHFAEAAKRDLGRRPLLAVFWQFAILMMVLMFGNILQISIWALLYRVFRAVPDWETALYFSGVTFTTLGYGDVVLHGRVRLLAPLEGANGVMMFGITTALVVAAAQRARAHWSERRPPGAPAA